jgi:hypothetical protein
MTARDASFTVPAPAKHSAFIKKTGAGSPVNSSVNTAAAEKAWICRVNDGIGSFLCYVAKLYMNMIEYSL